jgi:hypothetical protein
VGVADPGKVVPSVATTIPATTSANAARARPPRARTGTPAPTDSMPPSVRPVGGAVADMTYEE